MVSQQASVHCFFHQMPHTPNHPKSQKISQIYPISSRFRSPPCQPQWLESLTCWLPPPVPLRIPQLCPSVSQSRSTSLAGCAAASQCGVGYMSSMWTALETHSALNNNIPHTRFQTGTMEPCLAHSWAKFITIIQRIRSVEVPFTSVRNFPHHDALWRCYRSIGLWARDSTRLVLAFRGSQPLKTWGKRQWEQAEAGRGVSQSTTCTWFISPFLSGLVIDR